MAEREREERLREVAREHVRHLAGETAAGRTDPAASGRRVEHGTRPEKTGQGKGQGPVHDRIASPGGTIEGTEDTAKMPGGDGTGHGRA